MPSDAIGWGTRHWGIEFEFTRNCNQEALEEAVRYALPGLPRDMLRVADWEHTPNNNRDWVVKRDGSCGWEICTPKSKSLADMDRVIKVLDACNLVGARVNRYTGVHIHIETRDFDPTAIAKLVSFWIKCEGMLFWTLPRSRRSNRYCLHLSRACRIKGRHRYEPNELIRLVGESRYRALNIKHYLSDQAKVEVRVIEGLVDGPEVRNWVGYFIYFVNRVARSDYPDDLRWFGLEEFLNWMGWDPKLRLDPELEAMRLWWLRRFIKYASIKSNPGQYRTKAKAMVAQIRGDLS